jgi:hypothetical protein
MDPENSQKQKSRERKKEITAPSSPQQQQQQRRRRRQAAPLLFEILPLEELPCRRVRLFFTDERVLHHTTDEREKEMNETANYFHNALAKESNTQSCCDVQSIYLPILKRVYPRRRPRVLPYTKSTIKPCGRTM